MTERRSKPGLIVLTFALCGGAIGGLLIVFAGFIKSLLAIEPGPVVPSLDAIGLVVALTFGAVLLMSFFGVVMGALLGLPAALAVGAAYAWAPPVLQRMALAPVLGWLVSYALMEWVNMKDSMGMNGFAEAYAIAGACSALACAALVRVMGLDAIGAAKRAA